MDKKIEILNFDFDFAEIGMQIKFKEDERSSYKKWILSKIKKCLNEVDSAYILTKICSDNGDRITIDDIQS